MAGIGDWQHLRRFIESHNSLLRHAAEYFIIAHDLHEPALLSTDRLHYQGVVSCLDSIEIHVDHRLERDHSNRVRTTRVSYHAQVNSPLVINILRYDNSSQFRGHPDAYHKHLFDASGRSAVIEHVGRDAFPNLGNVIDEVFAWWSVHKTDLQHFR